jgi:hypothetical protein
VVNVKESGLEVKGTGTDTQTIQGTGKEGDSWLVKNIIVLFAWVIIFVFALAILLMVLVPTSPTALTSLQNTSDLNVTKLSQDLNVCSQRLFVDEYYLKQVSDLNFPFLTLQLPIKSKVFQGIIIVDDANRVLTLDLNTLTALTKQYGVTQ